MSVTVEPNPMILGLRLSALAKGFSTFKVPLNESVRRVTIPSIIEQFEAGGKPPWEPLADSTIERRGRQGTLGGEPQDILIETGQLFGDAIKLARWNITTFSASFTNLPSRSAYGRFHQNGATEWKSNAEIPTRPFVVLLPEDVDRIQSIFTAWASGLIITHWGRRTAGL